MNDGILYYFIWRSGESRWYTGSIDGSWSKHYANGGYMQGLRYYDQTGLILRERGRLNRIILESYQMNTPYIILYGMMAM